MRKSKKVEMKLTDYNVFELEKMMRDGLIPEDVLDSYVLYTTYFSQYALGVTGCNYNSGVYVSEDGTPFPYAAAAYKAAKDNGIKPYYKKGRDTAYGEVGCKDFKRTAITVREFLKMKTYVPAYRPDKFSTLKATA